MLNNNYSINLILLAITNLKFTKFISYNKKNKLISTKNQFLLRNDKIKLFDNWIRDALKDFRNILKIIF